MKREVREGMLKRGLPCLSFGDDPPLIVFPGLGMTNANTAGLQRLSLGVGGATRTGLSWAA